MLTNLDVNLKIEIILKKENSQLQDKNENPSGFLRAHATKKAKKKAFWTSVSLQPLLILVDNETQNSLKFLGKESVTQEYLNQQNEHFYHIIVCERERLGITSVSESSELNK